MPTVSLNLDNAVHKKLMKLANNGEDISEVVRRLLIHLADSPRARNVSDFIPVMAPKWFNELGSYSDRIVASMAKDIELDDVKPSDSARVAAVRSCLGIPASQRQSKPRKYDNEFCLDLWNRMKDLPINDMALVHGMGFQNQTLAIEWAEGIGLTEMVDRLTKRERV